MTHSAATRPIRSIADLTAIKERTPILSAAAPGSAHVLVGMNTCGIASGAKKTTAAFMEEISRTGVNARVFQTGCVGMCFDEPLVDVVLPGRPKVTYRNLVADKVARVVDEHLAGGEMVQAFALCQSADGAPPWEGVPLHDAIPYITKQKRIVLAKCGSIDPENIDDYIAADGYLPREAWPTLPSRSAFSNPRSSVWPPSMPSSLLNPGPPYGPRLSGYGMPRAGR